MKHDRRIAVLSLGVIFLLLLSLPCLRAEEGERHNYKSPVGYVPDKETAIRIAVAVWTPIYGWESIKSQKPYEAHLKDGIWYVSGSLPARLVKGGVAEAEIAKDDGRVLRVSHGK